jgi:hypothetical protein
MFLNPIFTDSVLSMLRMVKVRLSDGLVTSWHLAIWLSRGRCFALAPLGGLFILWLIN